MASFVAECASKFLFGDDSVGFFTSVIGARFTVVSVHCFSMKLAAAAWVGKLIGWAAGIREKGVNGLLLCSSRFGEL